MACAEMGNCEIAEKLIAAGAWVNHKTAPEGHTALSLAAGNEDMENLLRKHGAGQEASALLSKHSGKEVFDFLKTGSPSENMPRAIWMA